MQVEKSKGSWVKLFLKIYVHFHMEYKNLWQGTKYNSFLGWDSGKEKCKEALCQSLVLEMDAKSANSGSNLDLLFPVSWEQNDPQTCSQITLHLRADLGWKKCREAARSWKWGLGAKSAVNAGAQRSKEREAQTAGEKRRYLSHYWNWIGDLPSFERGPNFLAGAAKRVNSWKGNSTSATVPPFFTLHSDKFPLKYKPPNGIHWSFGGQ